MTFDAKIKLQAGFPAIYLMIFSLIALAIPAFLAFKSYQSELGWLWTGLITVFSLIALLRIFQDQEKQRKYSLQLDKKNAVLTLIEARSGTDKCVKVTASTFTLQTSKLVFASLMLENKTNRYLVFHGFLNHSDTFRRFKAQLKWAQTLNE